MSEGMLTAPAFSVADATSLPLADRSVAMTFTSPPYIDARTYGIGAQRKCDAWIEWMLLVVKECLRVTSGPVFVNCAGVTRDRNYQPGPEGLLYCAWKQGIQCYRPAQWHRVGIPGSGGDDWLRADTEYVLLFKHPGKLPYRDLSKIGHPPKYETGGPPTHRTKNGSRVNKGDLDFRGSRRANGTVKRIGYTTPEYANPGNVIKTSAGGGHAGHPLAHENEAPFPERLVEFFVNGWSRPGDTVLDPFSGSGTTACVAHRLGRVGIGFDIRPSQIELAIRRFNNPYTPKSKKKKQPKNAEGQMCLFGERDAA